jgi:hypothetical protein
MRTIERIIERAKELAEDGTVSGVANVAVDQPTKNGKKKMTKRAAAPVLENGK